MGAIKLEQIVVPGGFPVEVDERCNHMQSHGRIAKMDGAMMGLTGTIVGASAVGAVGIVRSIVEMRFPGTMAKTDHKHQMNSNIQSQRYEAVKCWRAGLADARDIYRRWKAEIYDKDPPNVVGDEWFEGLRPHLCVTGQAAKFRSAQEVVCDNPTLVVLSLEIGRIEKEWVDESKGLQQRARKRRR